ncbi:MAG: peptidase S41 [Desulfobacterales bacterium]|nr:MAG: peptidase S41 [Desulfobacterales bacterium]
MPCKPKHRSRIGAILFTALFCFLLGTGFRTLFAGDEPAYKSLRLFADVLDLVEKNYVDPVDKKELVEKAIQGMVHSLDPHSQLLPAEALEELQIDTRGEFGGIGIVITMQNRLLTVISPIEGTPAYKAGVKAGDIIIEVDGESTKEMMLWEAVKRMRGPKGESVRIRIVREGVEKPLDFTLVRDIIPIESVRFLALAPGYGYVRITNFQEKTADDLEDALAALSGGEAGLKGLILDLRDNPGGLLNQAVDVSDIFLDEGVVVTIKGRLKRHTRVFRARPGRKKNGFPMVILINGGSASASEIVAGALQDQKRAVILGTTSFGKGSVQTVETLRDGYGLKFTIARYYTPSGRSIQAEGIQPDIIVRPRDLSEDTPTPEAGPHWLKEKDLRNHLDAKPLPGSPAEKEAEKARETGETDEEGASSDESRDENDGDDGPAGNRYGPLNKTDLEKDNQIMRALEILKGHGILTKTES